MAAHRLREPINRNDALCLARACFDLLQIDDKKLRNADGDGESLCDAIQAARAHMEKIIARWRLDYSELDVAGKQSATAMKMQVETRTRESMLKLAGLSRDVIMRAPHPAVMLEHVMARLEIAEGRGGLQRRRPSREAEIIAAEARQRLASRLREAHKHGAHA